MIESNAEEKQNVQKMESGNYIPLESKVHLLLLGLLSISFVGYFALRVHWIGFIFAHLAALSIMGFYGSLAGDLAKKKGYSYWRAFKIGFFLPIILGGISAVLFAPSGEGSLPWTCGGWVCLAAGIVVVVYYLLIKKKEESKQVYS